MSFLVQRFPDDTHAAVHHVARRHDVGAGARVRQRLAREELERLVVVHLSVDEYTAVPMIRVLAHAHVGDHDELRELALERAHGLLHGPFVVPRARAHRILLLGNAEQQHAAHPKLGRGGRVAHHLVDRRLRHPGHRRHGLAHAVAGSNEQRQDELRRSQQRLANERAQGLGAAEPAGAVVGEGGHWVEDTGSSV